MIHFCLFCLDLDLDLDLAGWVGGFITVRFFTSATFVSFIIAGSLVIRQAWCQGMKPSPRLVDFLRLVSSPVWLASHRHGVLASLVAWSCHSRFVAWWACFLEHYSFYLLAVLLLVFVFFFNSLARLSLSKKAEEKP